MTTENKINTCAYQQTRHWIQTSNCTRCVRSTKNT